MDFHRSGDEGHNPVSVLDGEGSYLHSILSRDPSVGNSNGYYQYRSPGQIPFQWERQPGKCKFDLPKRDSVVVPTISPPPVSSSKSMEPTSRPGHADGPKGSSSSWSRMKFWRKIKSLKPRMKMPGSRNQARASEATSKGNLNGSSPCTSSDENRTSSSSNLSLSTRSSSPTISSLSFAIIKLGKRT